jgi:hypothetical protein
MEKNRAPAKTLLVLGVCATMWQTLTPPAHADAISPSIKETSANYSDEKPNSTFYGTGIAGRMSEASALRFQGEQDTHEGTYDSAIRKLAKAVQLDPGDPSGHLLYARALSAKIKSGKVTEKELDTALREWRLLWHHDSDQNEQFEAHMEARHLGKVAKALERRLKSEQKLAGNANPLVSQQGSNTH